MLFTPRREPIIEILTGSRREVGSGVADGEGEAIAPLNKTYLASHLNFDKNLINFQH